MWIWINVVMHNICRRCSIKSCSNAILQILYIILTKLLTLLLDGHLAKSPNVNFAEHPSASPSNTNSTSNTSSTNNNTNSNKAADNSADNTPSNSNHSQTFTNDGESSTNSSHSSTTGNNNNINIGNSIKTTTSSKDTSSSHRRRKSRNLTHSDSKVGLNEIICGDLKNPNLVRIEVPLGKPIEEVYTGVHDGPVLGSGISGIVRLVEHKSTQVKYAVKCLDLALIDSEEGLRQLKEEIYIMCQLVSRIVMLVIVLIQF